MFQKIRADKRSTNKELEAQTEGIQENDQPHDKEHLDQKPESYSDHDLAAFQEKLLHIHLP